MAKQPTQAQRKAWAKSGVAMPDGSYYITNAQELDDAIHAVGRGNSNHNSIREHIIKRASALGLTSKIPPNWSSDGSLKQTEDLGRDFLSHHGVKGMKWGVRRSRSELEGASADAKKAAESKAKVTEAKGTHVLSNDELKDLVKRMQLEQQYTQLASQKAPASAGQKFAKEWLGDPAKGIAKQQITRIANDQITKQLKAAGL